MNETNASNLFEWIIMQCGSKDSWNRFIVPLMKVETKELKTLAANEAKRRGYVANKQLGIYE